MSYKTTLGVTVDQEVKEWLVNWCVENKTNLSVGTNHILKQSIKNIENEWKNIEMINCKCGVEYSSKLKECPACKGVISE